MYKTTLDYDQNIFTVEQDGLTLTVEADSHSANPRDEEYATKLLLWGDNDFKGDENPFSNATEFESLLNDDGIFYKLPVFLDCDNRKISHEISIDSDCRHLGYILMTKEAANKIYLTLDEKAKMLADEKLKSCIKEYNDYVGGKIYCFIITNEDGDILDGGNNFYPQETMLDTINEMSQACLNKYVHLFDELITQMESDAKKQPLKKFANCNVIEVLHEVMQNNTKHYKSDFEYDKAEFMNAAYSPNSCEGSFLWLSRPNGTLCTTERNAYVKESYGHNSWVYYGEQTNDPIVAYAVEIKGVENGYVKGNLYELDYKQHHQKVKNEALPAYNVQLIYRHSERYMPYEPQWGGKITHEDLLRTQILPADLSQWDEVIKAAQNERQNERYEQWDCKRLKDYYAEKESCNSEMGG